MDAELGTQLSYSPGENRRSLLTTECSLVLPGGPIFHFKIRFERALVSHVQERRWHLSEWENSPGGILAQVALRGTLTAQLTQSVSRDPPH